MSSVRGKGQQVKGQEVLLNALMKAHDGGSGLCGALPLVQFGVPVQRCLFHKLHNIAQAIQLPNRQTI